MESVKQFEEVTVYVPANDDGGGGCLTTGAGIIINPGRSDLILVDAPPDTPQDCPGEKIRLNFKIFNI